MLGVYGQLRNPHGESIQPIVMFSPKTHHGSKKGALKSGLNLAAIDKKK